MANPTFDSTDLATRAGRCAIGSRRTRAYAETMPGVDGLYVQTHGHGGRAIGVTGMLSVVGTTPGMAHNGVMREFRIVEALADGRTVATLIGTGGHEYTNCLRQSYTHDAVRISSAGATSCTAYLPVRAQLLQWTP